jgi:hypothetical protein
MEAFLLGLSNGGVCLAYCAPVLVPCMIAGGGGTAANVGVLLRFLCGRLAGYLIFGVAAWAVSASLLKDGYRTPVIAVAYMALAVTLVLYGFFGIGTRCGASCGRVTRLASLLTGLRLSFFAPVAAGLATGVSLCPPFLLAMAGSAEKGSLSYSLFFFFMFFIGTSLFLVPAPLLGALRVYPAVRTVGRLAAGLMGVYYFFSGLLMLSGGMKGL